MATKPEAASGKSGRLRIFLILFSSFLAMVAATAVSVGYGVHRYWENVLRAEITRGLTEKTRMFADRTNSDREHKIEDMTSQEGRSAGARATVIDGNGRVLADSQGQVSSLEDEGRRPEFVAALHGETSIMTRKRNSAGIPVLYVAVPFSGGAVRLAYPLADIEIATSQARHLLFLGSAIAILAALAISLLGAGTVTS